eukprot:CAMPEP_0183335240 /NCGR_PEP_ID=MMETSP0164_2-20130417/3610_1 /TAXON_ID=221442 /ORGANISM="Coccolithus pelagicus ssp braarudi, Strain PLY182g" /LENGTH=179 /DNA_ID=CAMNT_0025504573 /DNA_START=210 /DNA_END=749 /DNA_ORIENTATION=-
MSSDAHKGVPPFKEKTLGAGTDETSAPQSGKLLVPALNLAAREPLRNEVRAERGDRCVPPQLWPQLAVRARSAWERGAKTARMLATGARRWRVAIKKQRAQPRIGRIPVGGLGELPIRVPDAAAGITAGTIDATVPAARQRGDEIPMLRDPGVEQVLFAEPEVLVSAFATPRGPVDDAR